MSRVKFHLIHLSLWRKSERNDYAANALVWRSILRLFWIVVDMAKSTPLCWQLQLSHDNVRFFVHTNQQMNINMWTTVSRNWDIDEVDKTGLFKLSKAYMASI